MELVADGIYLVRIPYPTPIKKATNAYIMPLDQGALLVDTGFAGAEQLALMEEALADLGLTGAPLTIFLTHLHLDHAGLVESLSQNHPVKVIMGGRELDAMRLMTTPRFHQELEWKTLLDNGVPREVITQAQAMGSHSLVLPERIEIQAVEGGDGLEVEGRRLQVLALPGHVWGHMGLLDVATGSLFSGDHLLFNVTPTIQPHPIRLDALSLYFAALRRVCELEPSQLLISHGDLGGNYRARVAWIIEHHLDRMAIALEIINKTPGQTGEDVVRQLGWSLRGVPWDQVAVPRKVCIEESGIMLINQLVADGKVVRQRSEADGIWRYYPA